MTDEKELAHQQFSDDLALYALGSLDAASAAKLEQHLGQCGPCRKELAELRAGAAVLALSATGAAAPTRSRSRLMAAIAQEKLAAAEPERLMLRWRRPWWSLAPVFASLLLALFAIMLWQENESLKDSVAAAHEQQQRLQAHLERISMTIGLLSSPDAAHVTLVSTGAKPQPQIKTIYEKKSGRLLLMATDLAPLRAGKTYELWLVPTQGAPIPAGLFHPDARGSVALSPSAVPAGSEAKAFAVTIEPESGSATPTMPIVMMGAAGS